MPPSPARSFISPLFPYAARFVPIDVCGARFDTSCVGAGRGETVLLLHGNPTWSFLYREVIAALAPTARAIAPDLLGFGRSDKLERFEDYQLAHERMRRSDEGLQMLEQPTLLLWGEKDPVFPPRVARKFRDRLRNVVAETTYPRASHFLQEDEPRDIARRIAELMAST